MNSELLIGGGIICHSGHTGPLTLSAGSFVLKQQTSLSTVTWEAIEILFPST
jgi:hypothetical protein